MKVEMTYADFELGTHKISIMRVKASKRYEMYHHYNGGCTILPPQPTQKKAINEARRFLRAVNHK